MRKRTGYISMAILLVVLMIFYSIYQSPIHVVETAIQRVKNGSNKNVNLRPEDVAKINSFFSSVNDNRLGKIEITYREVGISNNQSQVIADFQVVVYKEDHSVNKIFGGNLLFSLHKSSLLHWKIEHVDIGQNIKEVKS